MLLQLLREMASAGGGTSLAHLAQQLGVSEPLVEQMVADLVRLGYLAALEEACAAGACAGCSRRSACGFQAGGRVWLLTTKGRQAAGIAP